MEQNQITQLQQDWLEACEQVGIPAITTDTSARIMAIMYVHGGGEEEMVLNQKFVNDVKYIQRRFHIQGGEVPDETFVLTMQHYVRQLEQHLEECKRNNVSDTQVPEWAHQLMRRRYGLTYDRLTLALDKIASLQAALAAKDEAHRAEMKGMIRWNGKIESHLHERLCKDYEQANSMIEWASRCDHPIESGELIKVSKSADSIISFIKKELGII